MSLMHLFRKISCLLLVTVLAACTSAPRPSPVAAELAGLMAERLALAREVARDKQRSGAAVYDPVREAAILANLTARAADRGLPREEAESFFAAQIAASRQVQTELLARWAAGDPLPAGKPMNLQTELRPRLDALTDPLLAALLQARHQGAWSDVRDDAVARLRQAGYSRAAIDLAVEPLRKWADAETRTHAAAERAQRRQMRIRPAPVQ